MHPVFIWLTFHTFYTKVVYKAAQTPPSNSQCPNDIWAEQMVESDFWDHVFVKSHLTYVVETGLGN